MPKHSHFKGKEALESSHREIHSLSIRTKTCEEQRKENNDDIKIENIRMLMKSSNSNTSRVLTPKITNNGLPSRVEPSELPNFSDIPPIERTPCIDKDHEFLDDMLDDSLMTLETLPESDSESEDMGSCICITNEADSCICVSPTDEEDSCNLYSSASSSACSKQSHTVHFADEVGLPIQSIRRYKCDRRQREHSELLILCICPEKKTFEFLHVGYHHYEESATSVQDLMRGLPAMCTNPNFANARFVALYRNNGIDKTFENLCTPPAKHTSTVNNDTTNSSSNGQYSLPLQDCAFRENELVVAAIDGSSELAVLAGIGPLLSNEKILKTLKRARRSRRGLKFLKRREDDRNNSIGSDYHRQKSHDLSFRRRRKAKKESKGSDETHPNTVPNLDKDCGDLVDEDCHDYNPLHDVAEYHKQLLLGIFAVSSGTVVLSALGF